jgi:hypothetical protein
MGSRFSRIKINEKTVYNIQYFTTQDYYALDNYIQKKNKYSMYEYYFRECIAPLITHTFDKPSYFFLYGTCGCKYIARRKPNENIIGIRAIHYMDHKTHTDFIEGYVRLGDMSQNMYHN